MVKEYRRGKITLRLSNGVIELVDEFRNVRLEVPVLNTKFREVFVDILLNEYRGVHEPTRVEFVDKFLIYPREKGIGVIDTSRHVEWQVQYLEPHQILAFASVLANVKVCVRLQGDGCHNLELFINDREIVHLRPYINELELLFRGEVPEVPIGQEEYRIVAELFKHRLVDLVEIREYFGRFRYVAEPWRIQVRAQGRYHGIIKIEYNDKIVEISQSIGTGITAREVPRVLEDAGRSTNVQASTQEKLEVTYSEATLDDLRLIYQELRKQASELRRKRIRVEWRKGEGILVEAPSLAKANIVYATVRLKLMKQGKTCRSKILEYTPDRAKILITVK